MSSNLEASRFSGNQIEPVEQRRKAVKQVLCINEPVLPPDRFGDFEVQLDRPLESNFWDIKAQWLLCMRAPSPLLQAPPWQSFIDSLEHPLEQRETYPLDNFLYWLGQFTVGGQTYELTALSPASELQIGERRFRMQDVVPTLVEGDWQITADRNPKITQYPQGIRLISPPILFPEEGAMQREMESR